MINPNNEYSAGLQKGYTEGYTQANSDLYIASKSTAQATFTLNWPNPYLQGMWASFAEFYSTSYAEGGAGGATGVVTDIAAQTGGLGAASFWVWADEPDSGEGWNDAGLHFKVTYMDDVSTDWTHFEIFNNGAYPLFGAWRGNMYTNFNFVSKGTSQGDFIKSVTFGWIDKDPLGSVGVYPPLNASITYVVKGT